MSIETMLNYVNGRWVNSSTGQTQEQRNPADLSRVTGLFQRSSRSDAAAAIDAAQAAVAGWSRLPVPRRAEFLNRALAAMRRRQDEIARTLTLENGKTLRESSAEIESAIKEMDWQIAEGRRLGGEIAPSERDGVLAYVVRQPLGVVSVLCPWNFPFNVPCRKCTPALMAGNTVVMKPSSLTPRTGALFVQLFEEAGIPPGVINCVTGDGSTVGDELVRHPAIRAVSFTGSTAVGLGIHRAAAEGLVRTQLEMGGKNAVVVLGDADLDLAADAVALAAYACAGQWCTSTSRVVVESSVARTLEEKLLERVARIRVGNGSDPQSTMGPVCGETQRKNVLGFIQAGIREGARLAIGGQQIMTAGLERGCFIQPTVFAGVTPAMTIAKEEIFGPVLSLLEARDFDEAVRVANDSVYGLCSSIYTASLDKAFAFVERSDVGLAHVNLPSAHKEPQLPFGGVKQSGAGLPEAGKTGIEFFSRHKTVYVRYR
jgi:acyl-CoA reductase-like NAD-dependent aldehyde dehydrogenase